MRLSGIDAPESAQLCRGKDSLRYRCGAKAANDLDPMLKDRIVTCTPLSKSYDRIVAICTVGDKDIGAWMVEQGLALDRPKYSKGKYAADQKAAEREGRGMWVGSFTEPWLYRACVKAGGRIEGCSDEAKLSAWGRWRNERDCQESCV